MPISSSATGLRPGVCRSDTRPTAPFIGQIIYETDTGYLRVWDGSAWDYLSTKQDTIVAKWTSFTPTWTNLTAGNATQSFRYTEVGDVMHIEGIITLGSTSSVSTAPRFTIPNSRAGTGVTLGSWVRFEDLGVNNFHGLLYTSANSIELYTVAVNATYPTLANVSSTVPFTWGSGDVMYIGCSLRVV